MNSSIYIDIMSSIRKKYNEMHMHTLSLFYVKYILKYKEKEKKLIANKIQIKNTCYQMNGN